MAKKNDKSDQTETAPMSEAVEAVAAEVPAQDAPAELLTVQDLAKKHGHHRASLGSTANPQNSDPPYTAAHLSADVLHGWGAHVLKTGEQVKLSDADYLAALDCVTKKNATPANAHGPANKRTEA